MTDCLTHDWPGEDLSAWLNYIERLHPKSISMGLDRINRVIQRLQLKPEFRIITVAGTNGKGSTCAMLSQIYQQAGYRVACYTSPHLLRYNERVKINGQEATDAALCHAFAAVELARMGAAESEGEIPLTYFEIGTLAAIWHFIRQGVEIAILEIGLGGRLDAVNAFEPDCSVITSIGIDHQEFLGNTRESIGAEKAGVYRASIPAICGDFDPPDTLLNYARDIRADLVRIGHDFSFITTANGWQYLQYNQPIYDLPLPALAGEYQLSNACCAIAAVRSLQSVLPVPISAIVQAMRNVHVAGRFQTVMQSPTVILDVAHNPHAAHALANNLARYANAVTGKTYAVIAMLADKDMSGVIDALKDYIEVWYVASVDHSRSASSQALLKALLAVIPDAEFHTFETVSAALQQAIHDIQACLEVNENDKIIVFGSFFTVSSAMQYLKRAAEINFEGSVNAT